VVEGDELRFVKANPAYCALGGNPEAELVGRTMAEVFPDAAAHGSLEPHLQAMRTGERISQKELEFLARPGPERPPEPTWWNVELVPLAGEAGCPASLLIMAEDVTAPVLARRSLEAQAAELREREEWLQLAVEAANGGSWSYDLTTREAEMTDRGLVIHGLPPGEGIDIPRALATIHPEDRDWMTAELNRVMEQPQPFRFEYRVLWPDGTVHWILSQAQVSARPHGPRLVGLVQDITKRKQAEEQLRQLATVAEGSSDFVGIAGLDHQAIYLNPAGRSMVGLEDEAAVRATRIEDYLFPEDLPFVRETVLPAVMRERRWKSEIRFRHFQTGEPIAVIWDVFRVDDPRTGQPTQLVTVTRDIRPQKAAEQALRESEELLRLAEHAGSIGSFDCEVPAGRLRISAGYAAIYGMEPGVIEGAWDAWSSHVLPDDLPGVEAHFAEITGRREPQDAVEFRILRPDGQVRWIEARVQLTYDAAGNLVRTRGINLDITDRKQAERALRESEELFRLAEHAGAIGSFEWTPQTDRLRISTGYAATYGLEPGMLEQSWETWSRQVHPEDLPWIEALIAETTGRREPHLGLEFRIFRPDGQMRWVEARSRWIYDSQGSLLRVIGINVDITDRKQTEEALQASVELLRVAEFAGDTGSFEWNPPTGRLRLSPGCQAVYGFEPVAYDGAYEAWAERLRPEDRQAIETLIGGAFAEHRTLYKEEYDIVRPDGQARCLEGRIRITYDAEGRPLRVFGVKVDMTDRKRAEEALRESEATLRGFFDATAIYMCVLELDGDDFIYAVPNPRIAAFFDRPVAEVAGKHGRELGLPEEFIAEWVEFCRECQQTQQPLSREYSIPMPDRKGWYHGTLSPIPPGPSGRPRFALTASDITERRRVEESLRESEERFRLAAEATYGVVYDWELTTSRIWRSPGLVDVVGYTSAELAATSEGWWGLCHPADRDAHDQQFAAALASHSPVLTTEYRIRHKNGHYVWVWDRARIVYGADGQSTRVIGVTISIDDRKRAEERLKALNDTLEQRVVERTAIAEQRAAQLRVLAAELTEAEEQERRRLAKILHDHLQQLLVAARIKTAVLRRRAEDDNFLRTLEQIDDVLNQAITESRSLTVELSPPVLYDAGLAAGLDWLARQIEEKHGLRVEVDADPEAEPTDESTRVFLFQTVRELLLNVVKHAQTDLAHVELKPLEEDRLRLIVADAGVGFELSALESQGMSGGFGLFSIRERLELLGGHLAVEASPGGGTRMTVDIPRGRAAVAAGVTPMETAVAIGEAEGEEPRPPSRHEKTRVVLADDHAIVRQGLAGLLREQEAIEVVGEAADGRQAVEIAIQTRPDVVLMDVTMPGLNGIEATRRILSSLPQVRVIGLSMHEAADMANAMRKAGAVAYLRKDTDSDVLVSMIQAQGSTVQEGRT
jgi:PAS domain S-box-containing protein